MPWTIAPSAFRQYTGRARRGNQGNQQCSNCGRQVPADKIKKATRYISFVDPSMRKELRDSGAILPRRKVTESLCVSCAVHFGRVKIRAKDSRKPQSW